MRAVSASSLVVTILFQITFSSAVVSAFSFTFSTDPTQCSSLTVNVKGGTAPYRLNLIPAGPLPLGGIDTRTILDQEFSDKTFRLDALKLPADSQFIAIVSDATGVGTGGTSAILTVSDSNNTSCLPKAKQDPNDYFYFYLDPDTITLCDPVNITWDPPKGAVTLAGIIPGGQSFQISVPSGASHVIWEPQIEPGTSIFILAGDSRGRGSGGSSSARTVANGSRGCLNGGAYSSTQSPYAGQVSATSPPIESSNDKGGIKSPLIVGIIVGLLALSALAGTFLYLRRRKRHPTRYSNKVDLFRQDDNSHDGDPASALEPTPFLSPPPIRDPEQTSDRGLFESNGYRYSTSKSTFPSGVPQTPVGYASYYDRPPSSRSALSPPLTDSTNTWDDSRTDTGTRVTSLLDPSRRSQASIGFSVANPDGGGPVANASGLRESRKQPPPRMRPVNFLQHQDAGAVGPGVHEETELVELPPSYANVGRGDMGSPPPPHAAGAAPPR